MQSPTLLFRILWPIFALWNRLRGAFIVFVREDPMSKTFAICWFRNSKARIPHMIMEVEAKAHPTEAIVNIGRDLRKYGVKLYWRYLDETHCRPIEDLEQVNA